MDTPSNLYQVKNVIAKADELGMPAAQQLQSIPKDLTDSLFPDLSTHGLAGLMSDWIGNHAWGMLSSEALSYVTRLEIDRVYTSTMKWVGRHDPGTTLTLVISREREAFYQKSDLNDTQRRLAESIARLFLIYPYHAITKRLVPRQKWIKPSPEYLTLISLVPNAMRSVIPGAIKLEWLEAQKEVRRNPDIAQPTYQRRF